MGGPVERPIEIRTSAKVLGFFSHTCSLFCFFQDAMAIILKRSEDQTFSAPAEWDSLIKQEKAHCTI
jgi:hypothetical protein